PRRRAVDALRPLPERTPRPVPPQWRTSPCASARPPYPIGGRGGRGPAAGRRRGRGTPPAGAGARGSGRFLLALAGDAVAGQRPDLEPLERDLRVALLAAAVGAVVEHLQAAPRLGDGAVGRGHRHLDVLPAHLSGGAALGRCLEALLLAEPPVQLLLQLLAEGLDLHTAESGHGQTLLLVRSMGSDAVTRSASSGTRQSRVRPRMVAWAGRVAGLTARRSPAPIRP